MFVERDTGAHNYFEVPLIRAYDIFREAYGNVSGLARTVRGPSMSTFPGKVRIHGILRMHELMDPSTLRMLHDNFSYSAYDPTTPLMSVRLHPGEESGLGQEALRGRVRRRRVVAQRPAPGLRAKPFLLPGKRSRRRLLTALADRVVAGVGTPLT